MKMRSLINLTEGLGEDFYELRHTLEPGQCFRDREGDIVKLDQRVEGDGTKWEVALWWGSSWSYDGSTIEPGDLVERVPDPAGESLTEEAEQGPIYPYYPAQKVPLGLTLLTHDASAPIIQYVNQDMDKVVVAALWNGQIMQKNYRYNECVYIDVKAGWHRPGEEE